MNRVLDLRKTKLSGAKRFFKASPIVMIMAGLVVAGVASAALVSYLANDVVVDNKVDSPIKMSVNLDDDCSDSGNKYLYISSFGGDEFTYSINSYNQANNDVSGYSATVNEQTDGGMLTGEECTEVWVTDQSTGTTYDVLDDIYVVHSDGSLEQLISKTWNNPKLVTTICYVGFPNSEGTLPNPCTDANRDAIKGTIASHTSSCAITKLVLHQANKGTYRFTGQFADDLAAYAAEEYAK